MSQIIDSSEEKQNGDADRNPTPRGHSSVDAFELSKSDFKSACKWLWKMCYDYFTPLVEICNCVLAMLPNNDEAIVDNSSDKVPNTSDAIISAFGRSAPNSFNEKCRTVRMSAESKCILQSPAQSRLLP